MELDKELDKEYILNIFKNFSDDELMEFIYRNVIDYDRDITVFHKCIPQSTLEKWGKIIDIISTESTNLPCDLYRVLNHNFLIKTQEEFSFLCNLIKHNKKYYLDNIRNEYYTIVSEYYSQTK